MSDVSSADPSSEHQKKGWHLKGQFSKSFRTVANLSYKLS